MAGRNIDSLRVNEDRGPSTRPKAKPTHKMRAKRKMNRMTKLPFSNL